MSQISFAPWIVYSIFSRSPANKSLDPGECDSIYCESVCLVI